MIAQLFLHLASDAKLDQSHARQPKSFIFYWSSCPVITPKASVMINQTFYPIFTFFEQLTGLTVQILFQALAIGALMPSSKYHTIHDRNVKSSLVVCYFEHSINNYIGRFCWLFLICFLINAQKNSITLSTPLCRL